MIRTLRLFFALDDGKKKTVSINYVKETLLAADLQALMEEMIDSEFFSDGIAGVAGADLTARTTTVII